MLLRNFSKLYHQITKCDIQEDSFFKPQFFYLYTKNIAHEKLISKLASLSQFSFFETTRVEELNLNVFYSSLLLHFIIIFMWFLVKGCRKLLEKNFE
jgi:hypothetical protein